MDTRTQNPQREHTATAANDLTVREASKAPARESGTREGRYFEPRVDIYETADALVVQADLPGVAAEDVETHLENNLLTLTGTLKASDDSWRPVYGEYAVGHFQRQFRVGQQIDQAKISAALKDGVLTLTLPKVDHVKPRKIAVRAG